MRHTKLPLYTVLSRVLAKEALTPYRFGIGGKSMLHAVIKNNARKERRLRRGYLENCRGIDAYNDERLSK